VYGPWKRFDKPILEPRQGKWDSVITSNAASCVREDGSVLLVYKSSATKPRDRKKGFIDLKLGVAHAKHYLGPYERIRDSWIFSETGDEFDTEDAYIWYQDGIYHMTAKVFGAGERLIGENMAGYYATSKDGISRKMHGKAYSRTVTWEDGSQTTFANAERPQLLIENGKPRYLYLAVLEKQGDMRNTGKSYNICVPLL